MKITNITAYCLSYPYKDFIADGLSCVSGRSSVLVRVDTDTELYGIGEAVTFGGSPKAIQTIIQQQLAPLLMGEDPLQIEYLFQKMQWNNWGCGRYGLIKGGISGIDIALWDLLGKAANLPVARLLGQHKDRVKSYASGGFYAPGKTLDDLKAEMERYLKMGYHAFKIKVGRTMDISQNPLQYARGNDLRYSYDFDLQRISAVREAIGPTGTLMIDMNCTWSVEQVLCAAPFFDSQNIYWIEEPIRSDDLRGYVRIRQFLPKVRVAGIENEQGLSKLEQYLQAGALDVVQMNLGWCGGFTQGSRIAALAMAHHKSIAPHTFFSAILHAANIHFAAANPHTLYIESEENENPFRTVLLKEPLEHDADMCFFVPQKPGLGVAVNWDVVDRYSV